MSDPIVPIEAMNAPRLTSYDVTMLDTNEEIIGTLKGVAGGDIEYHVPKTVKGSGSITVNDLNQDIDWLNVRLRPALIINGFRWDLGVFIPSTPKETWTAEGRVWEVELLDKTSILDQDAVDSSFSLPKGANVTDAIKDIIESAGEKATTAITETDQTLRSGIMWEAGTTKIRIINDILDAAGYFALWSDGIGNFRAEPYVLPDDRASQWTFSDAEAPRVYLPEFTREEDIYSIPNRVVAVSQATGEDESMVSVAENNNPNSRFSRPSRGRWIVATEVGVEATDQEALDKYAKRRLNDMSSVSATFELDHAPIPLTLNWVITFTRTPASIIGRRATVQAMTIPLSSTELMKTSFREVTSI